MSAIALADDAAPAAPAQNVSDVQVRETPALGKNVERQLPPDGDFTNFVKDFGGQKDVQGDHLETKKVMVDAVKTIKLQNVVPPVHFGSGEANIPESYIEKVRSVLAGMADKKNVRLHLVGYTDNVPLRGKAKAQYGDNEGLSRERAGVAAEFFQKALHLPPESISYEGRGDANPVASNDTAAGRRLNRRMEVEVWYDEPVKQEVEKKILISELIRRVKVCRVEQVCKLSYKTGMAKRARVKNLIGPLHFDESSTSVPADYIQKLAEVLKNLQNKRNVVIKFIAYTDNTPLAGRDERIYGDQLGLSKARARRVALAVQDALHLPSSAVESDGMGPANPVAPNDTEAGRAANNRVEAEFWYDDQLQQLSSEPQLCPEAAGAETVTRVYTPPTGPIPPIMWENGKPVIPPGYAANLRTLLDQVKDRTRVRLRFIGFIKNERLDRRTAMAYGDDIGLSTARAYTVMKDIQAALGLQNSQVEHEGHGYVQSSDVVNAGFVEASDSKVEVQIVYDELAALDNNDELDITRMTREVPVANPYALNPMRITVDGTPIDDKGKSISDIDRCTDVQLNKADIQFKYDNLNMKPRLNVTAWPNSIRYQDDPATPHVDDLVHFRAYSNFPYFIARSEVRIFNPGQSVRDTPLAVIPVDKDGNAQWEAKFSSFAAPGRDLKFVLRVYDKEGNFDETQPQTLWVLDRVSEKAEKADLNKELLAGYGDTRLAAQNIPLTGGTVEAYGTDIPAGHTVYLAGNSVPVNDEGKFVAEEILPPGLHTVEVAVLDKNGNGQLYQRDMDLKNNDWFYVGIADVTASKANVSGPAAIVTNDTQGHYTNSMSLDGRLAFYTNGKFGDNYQLTASADTLEGPAGSLFSNFMQKSPDAFFRRINPDYYYPTYGDGSTTEQTAPTLGKFYVKLKKNANYGMWGNFKVNYTDNNLAQVQRTLYGANLHIEPTAVTSFGAKRLVADGFVAQPGTVAGRDDFRGTGGSLYYLQHQDVMQGSDRLRIEVRDKVSGIVLAVKNLTYGLDYTIDYIQGRVMLSAPLSPYSNDNLLVKSGMSSGGNDQYLVIQYEYSTGFQDTAHLSTGGTAHYWLNDHVKVGVTDDKSNEAGNELNLKGADVTLRQSAQTWVKFQKSQTSGPGTAVQGSYDGGFSFNQTNNLAANQSAVLPTPAGGVYGANRVDASIGLKDVYSKANGDVTLYHQFVQGGFAANGFSTPTDTTQYGGSIRTNVTSKVDVAVKSDKSSQVQGIQTTATEADVGYQANANWKLSTGVRTDQRSDNSPVVPVTQVQGKRTDAVVKAGYDSHHKWSAYTYAQGTTSESGNRGRNDRGGVGGAYQVNDKFRVNGEISGGDTGLLGKLGTEYHYSDKSTAYVNYALENDRTDNGIGARKGTMTTGVKEHYSDTTDIFEEEKYQYGDVPTGLTHSTGVQYVPSDRWNFKANLDAGSLRDNLTGAEIRHNAIGESFGYGFKKVVVASAIEYRQDKMQSPLDIMLYTTRVTWLTKNSVKYQINPDWRFIGRFNHSQSTSSQGDFYNGSYTEAVAGYGYRPVDNDRLNMLFKFTYFYNLPSAGQITIANTAAAYIQKDQIVSLDADYDLTSRWTVGGKFAHRTGQVSEDRVAQVFYQSNANLYIARVDWHFVREWDFMTETRLLSLPNAQDTRRGALVTLYRDVGNYVKLGVGYNFTDFSDDLTNLGYTYHGVFLNLVGKI
ncbi:MAG TPA: OmpA family protein [Gallionellaceae bacterium]|nr:OmpA family protein [Gallionellaceae bacterium]